MTQKDLPNEDVAKEQALVSPAVSVVIPVFNRAQLVHRAIQSVLDQTFRDFELIIVDDGSSDDLAKSLSSIKDPRIQFVVHDTNKGAAAARNTGVGEARGQYVAFLDSDDCWLPQKLEYQLQFMRSHQGEARLSCTAYEVVSDYHPQGEVRLSQPVLTEADMQLGCRVSPGSTMMAERLLFRDVGQMNENLSRLEDWDWLLRCMKHSKLMVLNEPLSFIDYRAVEKIDYEGVRSSVDLMRHAHFTSSGLLPSIARLKFLATLENELAASAYRNKRYRLALWHLLRSFSCFPMRSINYFKRIAGAVSIDIGRSISSRQDD